MISPLWYKDARNVADENEYGYSRLKQPDTHGSYTHWRLLAMMDVNTKESQNWGYAFWVLTLRFRMKGD